MISVSPQTSALRYRDLEGRAALLRPIGQFALALVYCVIMVFLYRDLSIYWEYLGFGYRPYGALLVPMLVIAATPALLLPPNPRSFSQFASWLLYFILFAPALVIPQLQGWASEGDAALLLMTMLASVFLFIGICRLPVRPIRPFHFPGSIFWIALVGLWALMHIAIFIAFQDTLSFAGIGTEVYEQRADAGQQVQGGLILYVLSNAAGAVNPVMFAIGLHERKWWAVGLGVLGELLVYSTLAGKIVLLFPVIILGTFFLFSKGRLRPMRLAQVMAAVAIIGLPMQIWREELGGVVTDIIDLLYMRTLYLPGVLVGAYNDFFSIYPKTYLSHSIIGKPFATYPYGDWSVGQVVGAYVTPGTGYTINNYNANFIAADGIASFGLAGIPIIVVLSALVLRLIDKLLGLLDLRLRCAALAPLLMWFADGSLLTALLTGGGILATGILAFYLATLQNDPTLSRFGRALSPSDLRGSAT